MRMHRRSFLQLTALAGGGLALGLYRSPLAIAQGPEKSPELTPQAFIHITPDGAVTILARGLSTEDFTQVRGILTSETVLEDPKLASKIVAAFSMSTSTGTEIYEVGAIGRGAPKAEGLTESNVNRA